MQRQAPGSRQGVGPLGLLVAVLACSMIVLTGVYLMLIAFGDQLDRELDRQVQVVQRDLDRDIRRLERRIERDLDRRLPAAPPATP